MLKVHEATAEGGELVSVYMALVGGALSLGNRDGSLALPEGALDAVMTRYGAPLDPRELQHVTEVAKLELAYGHSVRTISHLARFDVIARDYLVYDRPGAEPLCALATTVVAALTHLGRGGPAHSVVSSAVSFRGRQARHDGPTKNQGSDERPQR